MHVVHGVAAQVYSYCIDFFFQLFTLMLKKILFIAVEIIHSEYQCILIGLMAFVPTWGCILKNKILA